MSTTNTAGPESNNNTGDGSNASASQAFRTLPSVHIPTTQSEGSEPTSPLRSPRKVSIKEDGFEATGGSNATGPATVQGDPAESDASDAATLAARTPQDEHLRTHTEPIVEPTPHRPPSMHHKPTRVASVHSSNPPSPRADVLQGLVTEYYGRGMPAEVQIPQNAHLFPFRPAFLWRVVEHVKEGGLAKLQSAVGRNDRVWVVTPAFVAICQMNGEVQRLARLETIDHIAIQTLFKKKAESNLVVIKFKQSAAEPSIVLQLKQHKLNVPVDLRACLQILASARQAQCRQALRVESLSPEIPNVFKVQRLGPFSKESVVYLSPQKKIEMWGTDDEVVPRMSSPPRAFHDPSDEHIEAILAPLSPIGRTSTMLAEAAKGSALPPATNLRIGDPVRTKTVINQPWRVGIVSDLSCGVPMVAIGTEKPAIFPIVEPIYEAGVYRTLRDVHVFSNAGNTLEEEGGAQLVPQNTKVRVRELVDVNGNTWACLPSGRWLPAVIDGERVLEFHSLPDSDSVHPTFGTNPNIFDTDPTLDEGLEHISNGHGAVDGLPYFTSQVTVVVRVRPPLPQESVVSTLVADQESGESLICQNPKSTEKHKFDFDKVLWSAASEGSPECSNVPQESLVTQHDVISLIAPHSIRALLSGNNACVLAYGASGSGKTFTILGEGRLPGLLQTTLHGVLTSAPPQYTVRISFFEMYAEKVKDLLAVAMNRPDANQFKKHRVRVHPITGPYVEGVMQIDSKYEGLADRLEVAKNMRATGATHGNSMSSRSHAIMQIALVGRDGEQQTPFAMSSAASPVQASCLSIVDLAGSERARRYRDDNMVEASAINLSLTVLRKVIDALLTKEKGGNAVRMKPPYRESLLTFLLSESLGGNAVTTIVATVSPAEAALDDTLATLRYAARARQIVNKVTTSTVDEVVQALAPSSPRTAHALRKQYGPAREGLSDLAESGFSLGPPGSLGIPEGSVVLGSGIFQKEGEMDKMWQHISQSEDQKGALEAIIATVRQQEREQLQLNVRGTHSQRYSPSPPRDEAAQKLVSPPAPESPNQLRKLRSALMSESYRMLSPSQERASLERMQMGTHRTHIDIQHTPQAAKSYVDSILPTTLLAQDYRTPVSTRPGGSPFGELSPSPAPLFTIPSPPPKTRLSPRSPKGSNSNPMRFGNTMRIVGDLLAGTTQSGPSVETLARNAVEAAREREQIEVVHPLGSPSARLGRDTEVTQREVPPASPSQRLRQNPRDPSPPGGAWRGIATDALRRTRDAGVAPTTRARSPGGGTLEVDLTAERRLSPQRTPPRRSLRDEADALRRRVSGGVKAPFNQPGGVGGGNGGGGGTAPRWPSVPNMGGNVQSAVSQQIRGGGGGGGGVSVQPSVSIGGFSYVPLPSTRDPPPAIPQVRRRISSFG